MTLFRDPVFAPGVNYIPAGYEDFDHETMLLELCEYLIDEGYELLGEFKRFHDLEGAEINDI